MAGKGSLHFSHPLNLGAMGTTGTSAANTWAKEADVVIGVGTRYSDFTTASKTAFQHESVQFVNINVAEFDAGKHNGLALTGDARATLEELLPLLPAGCVQAEDQAAARQLHDSWEQEVDRIYNLLESPAGLPNQGALIGAVKRKWRSGCRHGGRRRQFAGRYTQIMAVQASAPVPYGIWLFLYGI